MCTSHDSRPPIEPISGAAADGEQITLKGADGAAFSAYLARPEQGTGAGIVILPDVRGLHPFFEELALRYAERGITAIAIDYFGRTAGTEPRGDAFEHMPHVEQAKWEHLQDDIRAAVARLRDESGVRSVFTTGFCMGGRLSSMSATLGLGLAGVIPFYGWPVGPNRNGTPAPVDNASKIECDVLAFYGEADTGIPEDVRNAYDAALDRAGVRHETITYPGAPHGFFDRKATEFQDAATDAWDRTLRFIRRHTMGQPIAAAGGGSAAPRSGSGLGVLGEADPAEGSAAGQTPEQTPEQELLDDPRISHFTGED